MSCLKPGSVFLQQGGAWVVPGRSIQANSNSQNFFYAVDSGSTPEIYENGLIFVGIIRLFRISSEHPDIRLSQNKGLFKAAPELIVTYDNAVDGDGVATTNLDTWGFVQNTVPLFRTSDLRPLLKQFNLSSTDNTADLHARLYRFQRGGGLECIPFTVGTASKALQFISGKVLDVLGATPKPPDIGLTIQ